MTTVIVYFEVDEYDPKEASDRVAMILDQAEQGHDLYDLSGKWRVMGTVKP